MWLCTRTGVCYGVRQRRRLSREYCTAPSSAEMMIAISGQAGGRTARFVFAGGASSSQAAGRDSSAAIQAFWEAATDVGAAVATATTLLRRVALPELADLQRNDITFKCAWPVWIAPP